MEYTEDEAIYMVKELEDVDISGMTDLEYEVWSDDYDYFRDVVESYKRAKRLGGETL